MHGIDLALWVCTAACAAIALARVASLGLWRTLAYGTFAIMLAFTLFRDIVLATVPYDTHAYTTDWCLTTRFLLVSHACAGLAVYRAIGRLYPKIGAFAAGLFAGCLLIASALTLGTLWWETRDISGREFLLRSTFLLWRWVDGITAGALVLAVVFLTRFPRPLRRMPSNLTWHAALLAAYFASSSLLYLFERFDASRPVSHVGKN